MWAKNSKLEKFEMCADFKSSDHQSVTFEGVFWSVAAADRDEEANHLADLVEEEALPVELQYDILAALHLHAPQPRPGLGF